MIRFTNHMPHGLNVPYPTARGQKVRTFNIPPMLDGKPGVLELAELDAVTLKRLQHHYDQRPVDMKEPNGEQNEIGLLKIEIIDGAPRAPTPNDDGPRPAQSASDLEPPRRDTRTAAAATHSPARKAPKPAKPPKPRTKAA
jgi:hypothetical protein